MHIHLVHWLKFSPHLVNPLNTHTWRKRSATAMASAPFFLSCSWKTLSNDTCAMVRSGPHLRTQTSIMHSNHWSKIDSRASSTAWIFGNMGFSSFIMRSLLAEITAIIALSDGQQQPPPPGQLCFHLLGIFRKFQGFEDLAQSPQKPFPKAIGTLLQKVRLEATCMETLIRNISSQSVNTGKFCLSLQKI